MKAFILAAGLGTRLRPLTNSKPKVMLEVAGQKILERTIGQLKNAGVDNLVINTHYFPEVVPNYFGDGGKWGVKIKYSFEPSILGTAGGLKKVEDDFKNEKEFLVIYGDNVFDVDFQKLVEAPLKAPAIIMLFDRGTHEHSGIAGDVVEVADDNRILGFWKGTDRSDVSYVNGGAYKLTPEIFKHIPPGTAYDFARQVFPEMLEKQIPLQGFVIGPTEAIFGADTPESLAATHKYFNKK